MRPRDGRGEWMRFVSRLITDPDEVALAAALGGMGRALDEAVHLVWLFASPHFEDRLVPLAARLRARWPGVRVVGCTGGGIIGDDHELEQAPALALLAARLPGVQVEVFHLRQNALAVPPVADAAGVVLLSDPYTIDSEAVLAAVEAAVPGAPIVGGLVSGGGRPYDNRLLVDDTLHAEGAVGVILSGDVEVDAVVAQGCRPIGPPLFITRAERNILYSLDNRPAMAALQDVLNELEPADRALARQALFVGLLPEASAGHCRPGNFLVRNLVGLDPRSGALMVGARLAAHGVVQFHVRDAATSAADLEGLLGEAHARDPRPAAGALLFSCLGRGQGLYGVPDHDLDAVQRVLGPLPVAGFFCNGEIGPVHGKAHLHGYTTALALLRPRAYGVH